MVENFAEIIIDNLPDALYAINMDGEVVIWNKQVENLTGVKKEDILGKGNYEYSLAFYGERVPALVDTLLNNTPELEKSFKNFKREGNTVTGERKIKNSTKILIGWASLLYDKNGNKLIGEVIIIKDITEAREHENNFIRIFDESPEPIIISELNSGKIVKINKAFENFIGQTKEEMEKSGIKSFDYVCNYTNDDIIDILNKNKKVEQLYIEVCKENGNIIYGILSSSIVCINEIKCIISIIRDITKQKNLEIYLKKIKKDSEQKINDYVVQQNKTFSLILEKYNNEIEEKLNLSQDIIKKLLLNENGGEIK